VDFNFIGIVNFAVHMEHYLINQKKINIEKNKEFLFKIPIRLNIQIITIIVENVNKSANEELVVAFYFKNIKMEDEIKEFSISTEPFTSSFSIRPNSETPSGEFLLYACAANKNANLEVSILTK